MIYEVDTLKHQPHNLSYLNNVQVNLCSFTCIKNQPGYTDKISLQISVTIWHDESVINLKINRLISQTWENEAVNFCSSAQ